MDQYQTSILLCRSMVSLPVPYKGWGSLGFLGRFSGVSASVKASCFRFPLTPVLIVLELTGTQSFRTANPGLGCRESQEGWEKLMAKG